METAVIIAIKGTQTDPDGMEDVLDLLTQGTLKGDADTGLHLCYQESALTGLEGTYTTFIIQGERIEMRRSGGLQSEMIFQEGERHLSLYETPYGGFMMGVHTQTAKAKLDHTGGTLDLCYVVDLENEVVGENTLHIEVKPSPNA